MPRPTDSFPWRLLRFCALCLTGSLILAGIVWPLPSYVQFRSKLDDFQRQTSRPERKLRQFHRDLKPGDLSRPQMLARLEQLKADHSQLHNRLAPPVNTALDDYQRRRLTGWTAALVGVVGLLLALRLTAVESRSPLDRLQFPLDGLEPSDA